MFIRAKENYHVQGQFNIGESYKHFNSAKKSIQKNEDDKALGFLDSSLIHFPFNQNSHLLLAELLMYKGFEEEALHHYRKARELKNYKTKNSNFLQYYILRNSSSPLIIKKDVENEKPILKRSILKEIDHSFDASQNIPNADNKIKKNLLFSLINS